MVGPDRWQALRLVARGLAATQHRSGRTTRALTARPSARRQGPNLGFNNATETCVPSELHFVHAEEARLPPPGRCLDVVTSPNPNRYLAKSCSSTLIRDRFHNGASCLCT